MESLDGRTRFAISGPASAPLKSREYGDALISYCEGNTTMRSPGRKAWPKNLPYLAGICTPELHGPGIERLLKGTPRSRKGSDPGWERCSPAAGIARSDPELRGSRPSAGQLLRIESRRNTLTDDRISWALQPVRFAAVRTRSDRPTYSRPNSMNWRPPHRQPGGRPIPSWRQACRNRQH